jgi:hypothetical protein
MEAVAPVKMRVGGRVLGVPVGWTWERRRGRV